VQNINISYAFYTVKYGVFEQGSHTGGSCAWIHMGRRWKCRTRKCM